MKHPKLKYSKVFLDKDGLNKAFEENIIDQFVHSQCMREDLGIVFTEIGDVKSLTKVPNSMPLRDLINFIEEKEKAIMEYEGGAK